MATLPGAIPIWSSITPMLKGLKIIARIGLTPSWARPKDTPLNYLDESAYDDFAIFAAAFAERYEGKVDYLIIGNEPNLNYEWGYRITTPEDYVNLTQESFTQPSKPRIQR